MNKKKSISQKVKGKVTKLAKKVNNRMRDIYYINKYYNSKIKENVVLVESKNGEDIASNMFYILKELSSKKYEHLEIYVAAKKNKIERFSKLLDNYKINNIKIIKRLSAKYLNTLASAKYLFNDTSFPALFVKKEGQVYTNTWHGTPLKCMSNDVPNRRYAMGNVKRNFMMTDYLVYPNDEMEKKMLSAYSMEQLYTGKILNAGYPRNAIFFNKERAKELRKELELDDKQVIVYMPTWRGLMTKRAKDEQFREIIESLRVLDQNLDDNQVFLVKMHILVQKELDFSAFKHIKVFPKGYETYDVLNVADCLVTDYSSVFFDYANSGKKIILFTYDREEYTSTRGLYYDLDDLPFPKVDTAEELAQEINKDKEYNDTEFIKKFCTYDNADADKDLLEFIINGKKKSNVIEKETKKNGKENVLIYTGSLALNGITSAAISLLQIIDLKKENIFLTFREKPFKNNPLKVEKFPKGTEIFPMIDGYKYSFTEIIACFLFYKLNIKNRWIKNKIDKHYKRELIRFFGFSKIDKAIQFFGYEKAIIGLFEAIEAPRAIFVHSDMGKEIKTRNNQHYLTLKSAYQNYDRVVSVTEDVKDSIIEISKKEDNIVIVNNAHNYKEINEKMEKEILFDEQTKCNVSLNVLKKILDRKDTIKFINVGRFSPEKGHKRLINAFNEFYKTHKNSFLFIIGGLGKEWEITNKYIKTLECKYNVILIRHISNPFPILKRCDLFILSSFYESLGLVILEAQTCGIPAISVNIKGPRGFMLEHKGYLVENSQDGILQGMNDFMEGKVKLMDFNPEEYNQNIKIQYETIFEDKEGEKNVKSGDNNLCKCP